MLTIKCEKCEAESSNTYCFGDKRFSYIDGEDHLQGAHLCDECQDALRSEIDKAIARFLGVESVRNWTDMQGIV